MKRYLFILFSSVFLLASCGKDDVKISCLSCWNVDFTHKSSQLVMIECKDDLLVCERDAFSGPAKTECFPWEPWQPGGGNININESFVLLSW